MKTIFIYDGADFYKDDDGNYYSGGTVSLSIWKRYLKYFDSLVAIGRDMGIKPQNKKLTEVSMQNVEIRLFSNINGFKELFLNFRKVQKSIRYSLNDVDSAIIRLPSISGLVACHEAKKAKIPYMVEVVGCSRDSLWYHGSITGKILAYPMYFLNRHFIKSAPFSIYVTQTFLQERYPNKGFECACSDVSLEEINESVLLKRKEKILSMRKNQPVKFGLIGSLNVDYKGHEIALRALSCLKNTLNFELRFLGDKNDKWNMLIKELKIEDKVYYDGVLPSGKAVYKWLDELDVLLMPSKTEGLPRSLVEGMSRGLPAIGSRVGGIPELLNDEYMFESNDYVDLSTKIQRLVSNKDNLLKSSLNNFEKSKNYSENVLNKRRDAFFSKFIKIININISNSSK